MTTHHSPIWDRGDPIDADMLAFTIGDDWLHDRRLVEHDIRASLAHVSGLMRVGLIEAATGERLHAGLLALLEQWRAGEWTLGPEDEDVHSAVERRLTEQIGADGGRMHLGRSRNDQVAVDLRLWLRAAAAATHTRIEELCQVLVNMARNSGTLPLSGYTHMRPAMPSTVGDWLAAHRAALQADLSDLEQAAARWRKCPLGSGSGYGIPLPLDRAFVATELGFDGAESPITAVQHSRGRPELAYLNVIEGVALNLSKLAADLWIYSTHEFGLVRLPVAFTTGSSLMPHKRNPDLIELLRGQCRQTLADRAALVAVIQDLPSGYHRDFQLVKPPLFRAHDRMQAALSICARALPELEWQQDALRAAASDPGLQATAKALQAAEQGSNFRESYRKVSRESPGSDRDGLSVRR